VVYNTSMTQQRKGDWIQTYTGRVFWPLDPQPEDVDIRDIAHALANQCRFAGHCREFYSVAQHSVLVALALPPELQVYGLLHDAAEAYLVDLPRPVKRSVKGYLEAEEKVLEAIAQHFEILLPIPEAVFAEDNNALLTEKRDLMAPCPKNWSFPPGVKLWEEAIDPLRPWDAELSFLRMADRLGLKGMDVPSCGY
jgi:uncharacterized protein